MKRFTLALVTTCLILVGATPLFAQDDYGLLARGEKRVYHACLYAHYIDHYCRTHAWGFNRLSFSECVIANGACDCVLANGGYWGPPVDDACRATHRVRVR
jgi:hypothetical protein